MTGGRDVFRDGRVGMLAISMLMEPGVEHSSWLTNVLLVTVTTFYIVYNTTMCLLRFVFGADLQGPYDVERFVV